MSDVFMLPLIKPTESMSIGNDHILDSYYFLSAAAEDHIRVELLFVSLTNKTGKKEYANISLEYSSGSRDIEIKYIDGIHVTEHLGNVTFTGNWNKDLYRILSSIENSILYSKDSKADCECLINLILSYDSIDDVIEEVSANFGCEIEKLPKITDKSVKTTFMRIVTSFLEKYQKEMEPNKTAVNRPAFLLLDKHNKEMEQDETAVNEPSLPSMVESLHDKFKTYFQQVKKPDALSGIPLSKKPLNFAFRNVMYQHIAKYLGDLIDKEQKKISDLLDEMQDHSDHSDHSK